MSDGTTGWDGGQGLGLDLDGTIYQTLEVKERAWHATSSNTRSVGIEIASPGAFRANNSRALSGVPGHYHIQLNKVDPGPAFHWDRVIHGARALLREPRPKCGAEELMTR